MTFTKHSSLIKPPLRILLGFGNGRQQQITDGYAPSAEFISESKQDSNEKSRLKIIITNMTQMPKHEQIAQKPNMSKKRKPPPHGYEWVFKVSLNEDLIGYRWIKWPRSRLIFQWWGPLVVWSRVIVWVCDRDYEYKHLCIWWNNFPYLIENDW